MTGFCKAASAAGVDPQALAQYAMSKRTEKVAQEGAGSTPFGEIVAGIPASGIPVVGPLANSIGVLAGLADDPHYEPTKLGPAFLPGVAGYRLTNRIKSQVLREEEEAKKAKSKARPVRHAVSEWLGGIPAALATAGVGAGLGGIIGGAAGGREGALGGTAIGAGIGGAATVAATVVGAIAAAIRRRRTAKEQMEHDEGSIAPDLLIPGVSTYNFYKRVGRSQGDREDDVAKKSKGKKGR